MSDERRTRPPFAPDLIEALTSGLASQIPPCLTPEMVPLIQGATVEITPELVIAGRPIVCEQRSVPGPQGAPDIPVWIFRRSGGAAGSGPGAYFLHGGGMTSGHPLAGVDALLHLVESDDAVVVTAGYRLAPQHPDPAPVDDSYSGLCWMAEHADELGFDASKLVIAGISAGAGLAAGVALLARDRGGPALTAQLLICPMLDDRNASASSRQMAGVGVWDATSNDTGWRALLGERQGGQDVSIYAAPGRATDSPTGVAGLPATWVDVGSAETFRDEAVAYAAALWSAGIEAELHVTAGGFHGFEFLAPGTESSLRVRAARDAWLGDVLARRTPQTLATATDSTPPTTTTTTTTTTTVTSKETASSFAGTWDVILHSPQGDQPLTLTLDSDGTDLNGRVTNPEGELALLEPALADGTGTWKLPITKPMPLTLEFKATVEGDAIQGVAKAGKFATIPFDGTRA